MPPGKKPKLTKEQRKKNNRQSARRTVLNLVEDAKINEGEYIKTHEDIIYYRRALRAFTGKSKELKEKRKRIHALNNNHRITNNNEIYAREDARNAKKSPGAGPSSVVVPLVAPSASYSQPRPKPEPLVQTCIVGDPYYQNNVLPKFLRL